MADTFRYKAFISYSHADERWGTWLHRALERYRVPSYLATKHRLPKAPLRPVFRDREELASSSSLSESIETALAASENLIVVCSPAAAQSKWVNEEIKAFEQLGRGDRIFCLIVDGSDDDCFPKTLAGREPLAADIREGADSRQDAKLRLISGLLNIQFGELKNREQRRRNRVLGASLATSLVIAGIMTTLAFAALIARAESEHQREIAEQALKDARAATDFLSEMLTDLDPRKVGDTVVDELLRQLELGHVRYTAPGDFVRNVNRFETARRLLEDHLFGAARQSANDGLKGQPLVEARVIRTLGESYVSLDRCDDAVELIEASVERFTKTLGPAADETLTARTALVDAYVCRFDDDSIRKAREIAEDVHQLRAATFGERHETTLMALFSLADATTDGSLIRVSPRPGGDALVELDPETRLRHERAKELYEAVVAGLESIVGPRDERVLTAKMGLANVSMNLGDLAGAQNLALEVLATIRAWRGPEHPLNLIALHHVARLALWRGQLSDAEEYQRKELRIVELNSGRRHPDYIHALRFLVTLLDHWEGRQAEAIEVLDEAIELAQMAMPTHEVEALLARRSDLSALQSEGS